ncbi:MAG TPA: hypothetical protein VIF38_05810 [Burkholderiales bacterium]
MQMFACGHAIGQARPADDDGYRISVGPAFERDLRSKSASSGAALSIEKTLIDEWLEVEAGVTRLNAAGRRETEIGFLFKKPFTLSQSAELMVGCGPQVTRKLDGQERGTTLGAECVLDFMFWPARNIGWYVEPSYGFGLGSRRDERSLGGSAGLLIRWQ